MPILKSIVMRFYLRVRIEQLSQGTPYYPVKGKNDYPISNREEYRSVALLLFFFVISAPVTQDSDSDKMRRK